VNDIDAIRTAARLQQMGIAVKSAELLEKAQTLAGERLERQQAINTFRKRGNRKMRRAAKRAQRGKGH
jgi:hypothetical protein